MFKVEIEPVLCVANGAALYEGNWRFAIKVNGEVIAMANNYLDADLCAAQIEMQLW